jgi:uncharacterized protein YlxP (DUF503 family)
MRAAERPAGETKNWCAKGVALIVGILQFELVIHDAQSLKDKRRVVRSVKDRLHREHQVSVAEVDALDRMDLAVLGLAMVGGDGRHVAQTLDRITEKLRGLHDAELGRVSRELLYGQSGREVEAEDRAEDEFGEIEREMLGRFEPGLEEER